MIITNHQNDAKQFCKDNIVLLCKEVLDWNNNGELSMDSKLRQLCSLLPPMKQSLVVLSLATSLVHEYAMLYVVNKGNT